MAEAPFSDWVLARPESVQRLMIDWPPMAEVQARPSEVLMIPAPGVVGRIASWFEDGTVGVEAPAVVSVESPITGARVDAGEMMRGQCDPARLEIVGYAEMPDGTVLDPACIRAIVESGAADEKGKR